MVGRFVCTLFAGFLVVANVHAQVPAKSAVDSQGDPLPPGAVARLGTLRFKHLAGPNLGNSNLPWPSLVTSALFSPNGKKIVSAALMAGTVHCWDAATGKEWPGPWSSHVLFCDRVLAFSPDGKLLAVHGADQQERLLDKGLMLWDIAEGKLLRRLPVGEWATSVAFAEDGKTIVSTEAQTVSWWDVTTGKQLRSWKPFAEASAPQAKTRHQLALSPGAKYLVARLWHVDKEGFLLTGHEAIFDVAAGKELWRTLLQPSPGLRFFAFSADNKRLAFLSSDKVEVCDASSGKVLAKQTLPVPFGPDDDLGELALSSDGSTVAVSGIDSQIFVWNTKDTNKWRQFSSRIVQPLRRSTQCLTFSPDGKTLLVPANGDLQLYELATLEETLPFPGHRDWVDYLAFSADGKRLLTGSAQEDLYPREVVNWEVGTWKRLSMTSARTAKWPNMNIATLAAEHIVGTLSPEHTVFTGKTGDDRFNLYDFASGKLLGRLQVPAKQESTYGGFFAPGGKFYVLTSIDAKGLVYRLYAVPSGKLLFQLPNLFLPPNAALRPVAFSADGQLVAVHAMDSAIYVLATADGKLVRQLGQSTGTENVQLANLAFSPDGKSLASWVDADHTVRLWDLKTGKERLHITGLKKRVAVHFAWSPDGRMFAVGSSKIQVWELATHKLRCEYIGHEGEIRALAFSADSRLLASGSTDTTVLIWDVTGTRIGQ
jgi:WD40 repeat protein